MTNGQDQAAPAGPLNGVRVIDLSAVLMGPYATQIFGDHGADVIKIESPEGDSTRWIGPGRHPGMGPLFLHLSRNKRSVALDLKTSQGAAAMRHLIEGADVFVHNLRPASIARLGLDYERVSAINPRIIWCGVYGYGEDGPYAGRPAYDDLIQGAVGIAALQQRSGASEPRYVRLLSPGRRPYETSDGYICALSSATICGWICASPTWPAAPATLTRCTAFWVRRCACKVPRTGWRCSNKSTCPLCP
jgi:hypothetical protein